MQARKLSDCEQRRVFCDCKEVGRMVFIILNCERGKRSSWRNEHHFCIGNVENGVHRGNESHIQHGECRKWCSSKE
ncbi:hypothetical protein NST77_04995 [Niallia sp. FSL W8-0177]|uniref:hypothetical protein n=1 Tax=Niallia sp. FSL W8-0177 TaxID=2954522 RepID=UPI0030FAC261